MASETLRPAGTPAPARPQVGACTVLVVSRDPLERHALVLRLGAEPAVAAASASGFHMAVPMIWSAAPDVVLVGALNPADARRLGELRQHAPRATLMVLGRAGYEYGDAHPDVLVPADADVLGVLAELHPA